MIDRAVNQVRKRTPQLLVRRPRFCKLCVSGCQEIYDPRDMADRRIGQEPVPPILSVTMRIGHEACG